MAPFVVSPTADRHDPLVALVHDALEPSPADAVFLGFGLAARSGIATGDLPVDALAMILLAEEERAARGAGRVIHLIADEHAKVNRFARGADVTVAADRLTRQLERVVRAFRFDAYDIVRASELEDPLHAELHAAAAATDVGAYAARQAADVEWALRAYGAGTKIGWTMTARVSEPPRGFDERYFDLVHAGLFGPRVSCVYTHPGRTLDPARPRCSPYTMLPGEGRLALHSPLRAIEEAVAHRSMRKHLRRICERAEGRLGIPGGDGDLVTRLRDVLIAIREA
jgi:hypothetical protein